MVKIVGKDPKAIKHVTCKNCASILEYLQMEVQHKTSYDYGGGTDTDYFINCPECNEKVYVKG